MGRVLESHSSLSTAITTGRLTQYVMYRMLVSEVLCDVWCDCCASRADRHTQHTLRQVYITKLCNQPASQPASGSHTKSRAHKYWQTHKIEINIKIKISHVCTVGRQAD